MRTTWDFYELPEVYIEALALFGYGTPEELKTKNRPLFAKVCRYAIRRKYDRFRAEKEPPIKLESVRRILARLFDLSPERIKTIVYVRRDSLAAAPRDEMAGAGKP